jgi:hypothetical protein
MAIVLSCPDCGRKLRVPDELLGKKVKCPACGKIFRGEVESPTEAPPPEEEPLREAPAPMERGDESPYEEERPSRRSSRRGVPPPEERAEDEPPYEEERPSRRSSRRAPPPDEDDDYDDRPSRRRRDLRPGKVQAIAIMTLIGGIWALFWALVVNLPAGIGTMGICCIPGIYGIVMGIMAIIKGSQLLGEKAHQEPPPKGIAIMMIINIINFDVVNLILGIICLVFMGDPEVQEYFRG